MATILTSRVFNQDTGGAKRSAEQGPVFITDRGRPAHVLLSIDEYLRLTGTPQNPVAALGQPFVEGVDEIHFNPGRADLAARPVDLE